MSGSIGRESRAALTIVKFSTPITAPETRRSNKKTIHTRYHRWCHRLPRPFHSSSPRTRNYPFFRRWRRSRLCVLCMTLVSSRSYFFFFSPFLFFSMHEFFVIVLYEKETIFETNDLGTFSGIDLLVLFEGLVTKAFHVKHWNVFWKCD